MSIYSHEVQINTTKSLDNVIVSLENYINYKSELENVSENVLVEQLDADEGYGAKLRPVYIVLLYSETTFDKIADKIVKGQSYWHAAIGFGPALSRTYSFNFGAANANKFKGGLSFESLSLYKNEETNGTMQVSCIFLEEKKYKKLKATLEYYIRNKEKTKYAFGNLINSFFKKSKTNNLRFNLVCSEFVDTILRSVNINLSGEKYSNLVRPDSLKVNKHKEKQFKIYEGPINNYDVEKATALSDKLANDVNNEYR